MNRDPIVYALVGGLVGGLIVWVLASTAVNNNMPGMMRMMGMRGYQMGGQVTNMMEEAVEHMDGIDMAELAKSNTSHDEVKDLAADIISAQTREIDQMKSWQESWESN